MALSVRSKWTWKHSCQCRFQRWSRTLQIATFLCGARSLTECDDSECMTEIDQSDGCCCRNQKLAGPQLLLTVPAIGGSLRMSFTFCDNCQAHKQLPCRCWSWSCCHFLVHNVMKNSTNVFLWPLLNTQVAIMITADNCLVALFNRDNDGGC